MQLIDTHTHIFASDFKHDLGEVIHRAKSAGVIAMVMPNIDSTSVDDLHSVASLFPGYCLPCMGLHPTSVKQNFETELQLVEKFLANNIFIGIGEIGIDLYWDKTFLEEQKIAFRHQLQLAKKLNLPVIIHSRNSFDEILEIVDQENDSNLRGIFHSFSGNLTHYKRIVDYGGFLIGIGGVVTYKNGGLDSILRDIDINHIVIETDSPYLTPVPFRGKRNESAYLTHIVAKIADVMGVSIDRVAEATTRNAANLFKLNIS